MLELSQGTIRHVRKAGSVFPLRYFGPETSTRTRSDALARSQSLLLNIAMLHCKKPSVSKTRPLPVAVAHPAVSQVPMTRTFLPDRYCFCAFPAALQCLINNIHFRSITIVLRKSMSQALHRKTRHYHCHSEGFAERTENSLHASGIYFQNPPCPCPLYLNPRNHR